jgi:hypothetical protein
MVVAGCVSSLMSIEDRSTVFDRDQVRALAEEIGDALPETGTVAVQPIRVEEAGISDDIARGIEDVFSARLLKRRPSLTIKPRRDLMKVWDEVSVFAPIAWETLCAELGVDFLVVASARPSADGIEISFKSYEIRGGMDAILVASSGMRNVRVTSPYIIPLSPEKGASVAALGLFPKAVRYLGGRATDITVRGAGERSQFEEYLSGLVIEKLDELGQSRRDIIAVGGEKLPAVILDLRTRVWDHDAKVTVGFALEAADGREVAHQSVVLDGTTIAQRYRPLARSGPVAVPAIVTAVGEARIGPDMNGRQAATAARMLARGDVVQQVLGAHRTFIEAAKTLSLAHRAMGTLGPAIPYDEVWQEEETGEVNRIRVRLKARVRRLDRSLASSVQAHLVPSTVRTGAPIRIEIASPVDVYIGVFAWQADNTVLRVFPEGREPYVRLLAGENILLPPDGGAPVVSRPLHDAGIDLEAMVVVASVTPLDYRRFGREIADSEIGSINAGLPAGLFLDQLALEDARTLSAVFLPYVVRSESR